MSKSYTVPESIAAIDTKIEFMLTSMKEMKENIKDIHDDNDKRYVTQKEFFLYKMVIAGMCSAILLFFLNVILSNTFNK